MRSVLLATVGLLCLAASALAQNATVTTQTPPNPNARSFMPMPGNSVPVGSATATTPRAGDSIGATPIAPQAAPVPGPPGTAGVLPGTRLAR